MTLRPLDPAKAGEGIAAPRSFLQTPFWAAFKAAHGWLPLYFAVDSSSEVAPETPLTVLVRRVAGPFSIAYVPMGPDPEAFRARKANADPGAEGAFLGELARALAPHLPPRTLCVRFDAPIQVSYPISGGGDDEPSTAISLDRPCAPDAPARKAPIDVQPPDTVIVDLTRSEDDILAGMRSKWRYNARLAERKGVRVACLSGEEARTRGVETFWNLYTQTAERDGIALHARAYYEDLLARAASYAPTPLDPPISVRVYLAEHEGRALASIITIFAGEEAVYLYGASSNEKRNLMPAYALQWRAIRDAKEAGCSRYDLYGIPPSDDPAHPMRGLYLFKTGFGGAVVRRQGSVDVPVSRAAYACYRAAEMARALWYKRAKKLAAAIRRGIRRKS